MRASRDDGAIQGKVNQLRFITSPRQIDYTQYNNFSRGDALSFTYCMATTCPLRTECERFEVDAASHCVFRTYADFSEELIREKDNTVSCPFFMEKSCALRQNAA